MEFIVYKGSEFTIEWYYNDRRKSPAKTYFDDLSRERKLEAFELFMTMAKIGKILNITKFRFEGDSIWECTEKMNQLNSSSFPLGTEFKSWVILINMNP